MLPVVWIAEARLRERPARPWRALLRPWLLPGWLAALAVYLIARAAVVHAALGQGLGAGGLSFAHIVTNARLLSVSLGKLLFAYPLAVLATPQDTPLWPGLVALLLAAGALWLPGVDRRRALFALGLFVAFIAPSLPASSLLILESRLYLPAIAFVLFVCELASAWRAPPRAAPIAAALVLCALAAVTFRYSASFRDRITFFQEAVRTSPRSSLAHRNLGVTLHLRGDIETARREYKLALAADPNEPIAHNNLGVIYMSERQLQAAETELRAEIAINPRYAVAHRNLAQVLHALGRDGEAVLENHEAAAMSRVSSP